MALLTPGERDVWADNDLIEVIERRCDDFSIAAAGVRSHRGALEVDASFGQRERVDSGHPTTATQPPASVAPTS